jgi:two-component system CheB/CheR fusion protein
VHQIELEMQNEELRSAQAALEAGVARYTELFDFAPIGYATLCPGDVIREINHVGARILGKERSRLIGRPFGQAVSPRDRAQVGVLLERAARSETTQNRDVELLSLGDSALQVRLTVTVLPAKEPTLLLALEDVTEQRANEALLALSEQALREADRRKNEFLAVLSHELRNPLAPIRHGLFLLAREASLTERGHKAHAIVDRQVSHLTRLVDDLLDVTRIQRGKIQLQRERVELIDLVRRTMDDHRTSFEAAGIDLSARSEVGPIWVDADPTRLTQVVSNLLGNAEKFTPRGGLVVVSVRPEGPWAVVSVRDSGSGIDAAMIESLFEPFAQAPQTIDRSRGGLGLGLSMVKGLIELHGGTVSIASAGQERGTEVRISLPIAHQSEVQPTAASSQGSSRAGRRVLIIEDNEDAAEMLAATLGIMGHEVETTGDGPSGLGRARSFLPEVVICDVGLPGMDGYEVARAFRSDDVLKSTYLVALSGYAGPEDRQRAVGAGFDRHVAKPATLERLAHLLEEAPASKPGPRPDDAAASQPSHPD